MIAFGLVKPGSTLRIPFDTFAAATGAPTALSNFAVGDILVYKDGSTTERASTTGYTATTTFDSLTGLNEIVIDLSSDATGDFFKSGSNYTVAVSPVTADGQTMTFWAATFTIGYPDAILNTSIATLASQTSFTLTTGPAEDSALKGLWCLVHSKASAIQVSWAIVSAYTGSTKTVTLAALPALTFTAAAIDNISFFAPMPLQPSVVGATEVVQSGDSFTRIGVAGAGLTNIDLPDQAMNITGNITGNLSGSVGSVTGAAGSVTGAVGSVTGNVGGNVTGSVGSVTGAVGFVTGNVGGNVVGSVGSVVGAVGSVTGAVGSVTGNVGGNVVGSVASVTAAVSIAAGQLFIKKNTAYSYFKFLMTDATTHAPAPGLTVTATRAIDNGAFGACANAVAELASGWYKIDFANTDFNGTDIAVRFTAPGADDKNLKVVTQT